MLRIIAKALSKAPETRYQMGRELADDLLAITRPGFVPTVRSRETPTIAPDASPGDVPTVSSPATAQSPPTIGSRATTPSAPGLAPTVLTPPPVPPLPQKAAATPPPRPPRPPVAAPARRKGGGAGLIVGLGLVGLLLLGAVVGGGLYFLRRAPASEVADGTPTSTTPAAPEAADGTLPAEAAPTPAATQANVPPSAPPSAARGTPPPVAATPAATQRATPPPPPANRTPPAATQSQPAAADYGYLDELPPDAEDGRAAGEALAQKYRSGGSGSYTGRRFNARPRVPRGMALPERPAAATLLYLHSAQEAFHRKNSRYGTLQELKDTGQLRLDVPLDASGFTRTRYAFRVQVTSDGYRAEAVPVAPIGRPLMVDDSGFVRFVE